jgi:hypothetical protein
VIVRRDVVVTVLLMLVTCGLYWLYWNYQTTNELKALTGKEDINPGLELLLSLVTCGLFGVYTEYRNAQLITEQMRARGRPHEDKSTLILILNLAAYFVGLTWVVASAFLQQELNALADASQTPVHVG